VPSRVLLLHGPNLNLLIDLPALDADLEERAEALGIDLKTFQANSEGALVDALHAERTKIAGVIVNAAKLSATAEVLAEALSLVKRPAIEVVLDAGAKSKSALKGVVLKQVTGKDAYAAALEALSGELRQNQNRPTGTMLPMTDQPQATMTDEDTGRIDREQVKKTLGRKTASERTGTTGQKKTIGRSEGTQRLPTGESAGLTRALVKEKIAERLAGKLSPGGLATWARSQWQSMQRGVPVESGQRDRIEDVLQTLLLTASSKANDHQLIELMTQLG